MFELSPEGQVGLLTNEVEEGALGGARCRRTDTAGRRMACRGNGQCSDWAPGLGVTEAFGVEN